MRYFVGLLSGIKGSSGGYDEKIVDMARNVGVITDELHKRGYLDLEEPPAIASSSPSQPNT
jgi:hypothetical protein